VKIAILFDGASALAKSPDLLILGTVEAVERSLLAEGNEVVRIPVLMDGRWIERVRRGKFDLAFNVCEGIDGVATFEPPVIGVLELFGIPYTGSSSYTTSLCLRKHVVNALLDRAGLPIPRFTTVRRGGSLASVGFPSICKPAAEDASLGVEQRSVVRTMRALTTRIDAMLERWDEVLVQRYIDGREINVAILGDTVLPIAEIDFGAMPRGMWRIVTYQSKWLVGSDEDIGAAPRCPADLPPKLASEVRRIALNAWRLVGGHGYGRVDMRIDSTGKPWILEVNANPDIAPDAGLARMAGVAGIEYPALVRTMCELGLDRNREGVSVEDGWALAQRLSGITAVEEGAGVSALDLFAAGREDQSTRIGTTPDRDAASVSPQHYAVGDH
jgi:D-alanine-D-alanine ligase